MHFALGIILLAFSEQSVIEPGEQSSRHIKGEMKWDMKAEIGRCMMRPVPNAARHARYLSNQLKGGLYTAGTATNQDRDSEILLKITEFPKFFF